MEIRRGILRDFDSGDYRATVEMAGSASVWLTGIAVTRNIDDAQMVNGRSVAVVFFDAANPDDAVLFAVWE